MKRPEATPASQAPRTWRPPTRRAFAQMIAAAAAAIALRDPAPTKPSAIWIGHY